jgi:C_GCAxxG_C_C family probable redox protein
MSTAGNRARAHFESGYKCAESVLLAVAEEQGIENEFIPSIASGFCSGMGRTGGLCGAVAGGVMALGLSYGRQNKEQSSDEIYAIEKIFLKEFAKKFGSTNCEELVHCDFNTPEGQAYFSDNKLYLKCHQMVEDATEMVLELIDK